MNVQGPVHAYVAVPGGKTSYLSELRAGKEVIVVDQEGRQRTAIVGRVKIETRQLILVQAKVRVVFLSKLCILVSILLDVSMNGETEKVAFSSV